MSRNETRETPVISIARNERKKGEEDEAFEGPRGLRLSRIHFVHLAYLKTHVPTLFLPVVHSDRDFRGNYNRAFSIVLGSSFINSVSTTAIRESRCFIRRSSVRAIKSGSLTVRLDRLSHGRRVIAISSSMPPSVHPFFTIMEDRGYAKGNGKSVVSNALEARRLQSAIQARYFFPARARVADPVASFLRS